MGAAPSRNKVLIDGAHTSNDEIGISPEMGIDRRGGKGEIQKDIGSDVSPGEKERTLDLATGEILIPHGVNSFTMSPEAKERIRSTVAREDSLIMGEDDHTTSDASRNVCSMMSSGYEGEERLYAMTQAHKNWYRRGNVIFFARTLDAPADLPALACKPSVKIGDSRWKREQYRKVDVATDYIKNRLAVSDSGNGTSTNGAFITLTFNRAPFSNEIAAWVALKKSMNPFLVAMRRLGLTTYLDVKEAHSDGFPHVHMVALFKGAHRVTSFFNSAENTTSRRMPDAFREGVRKAWPYGFIDVQAIVDPAKIKSYIMKDVTKTTNRNSRGVVKSDMTHMFVWYTEQRWMSYSREIADLIKEVKTNSTEKVRMLVGKATSIIKKRTEMTYFDIAYWFDLARSGVPDPGGGDWIVKPVKRYRLAFPSGIQTKDVMNARDDYENHGGELVLGAGWYTHICVVPASFMRWAMAIRGLRYREPTCFESFDPPQELIDVLIESWISRHSDKDEIPFVLANLSTEVRIQKRIMTWEPQGDVHEWAAGNVNRGYGASWMTGAMY